MKISTKGRYGLTIMMELAREYGEGPISLKKIASRHQLSEPYLEQLVAPLRNAGLVQSTRGANGGYRLTRSPQQIKVGEILKTLEGPLTPCDSEEDDDPAKRFLWKKIQESVEAVLESITLEDLIHYQDEESDAYMFYI